MKWSWVALYKVLAFQSPQNLSLIWRYLWGMWQLSACSGAKEKEGWSSTEKLSLACWNPGRGMEGETHSFCVGTGSRSALTHSYVPQLLLKTSLQGVLRRSTHRNSIGRSELWMDTETQPALKRPASEIRCAGREENALRVMTFHVIICIYCNSCLYNMIIIYTPRFSFPTCQSLWDAVLNQK
jgi:hypothetical protein